MYNLNLGLAATAASAANCLLVEGSSPTPRTPEILNSLIAMTNPLDGYTFGEGGHKSSRPPCSLSTDSNSSSSSQVESPTTNPPSVQSMCSQLIKAGLKLSIEQKRKHQPSEGEDLLDLDKVKRIKRNESESEDDRIKLEHGLTPEDEERRRRRRERNKIAATKCRLKKRERTANLVQESETLEAQNVDLKAQVRELTDQRRQLAEMLALHRPLCPHNIGPATREALGRLPPVASVMETNGYRPASVDDGAAFSSQNLEVYSRPVSTCVSSNATYTRANIHHSKPANIIVEEIGDFDQTNFDTFMYNTQQCHSYSANQNYNGQGMDNGCMA